MNFSAHHQLKDAPVLLEIFRGHHLDGQPISECVHRGLVIVLDGLGNTILSMGDAQTPLHMRSCAKPFQVMPLLETGAFSDTYSPRHSLADLALMMSSHAGQRLHTDRVKQILSTYNLDVHALRCGAHAPNDHLTQYQLLNDKEAPSQLHNNCSGKHAAMLITSLLRGYSLEDYEDINHPLQQQIKIVLALFADTKAERLAHGIDGCSLPSFVLSAHELALMYARLSAWRSSAPAHVPQWITQGIDAIWQAAMDYPDFIAGPRRFDTVMIKAGRPHMLCKSGADGLQAIAIAPSIKYPHGLGIIIKIADGDPKQQTRIHVLKAVLDKLKCWPKDPDLDKFIPRFKNYRGLVTGGVRTFLDQP